MDTAWVLCRHMLSTFCPTPALRRVGRGFGEALQSGLIVGRKKRDNRLLQEYIGAAVFLHRNIQTTRPSRMTEDSQLRAVRRMPNSRGARAVPFRVPEFLSVDVLRRSYQ